MTSLNLFRTKPKLIQLNQDEYLKRIEVAQNDCSLKFLRELHRNHLLHIPFENLDIHYQKRIELDYRKVFNKIVTKKRGGFCYELNGLFYHLLTQLGFETIVSSARPYMSGTWQPEFDHMVLIIKIEPDLYLCDVGFGELMTYPKKISLNEPQLDYTTYFRFVNDPDGRWILQKSKDNSLYHSVYSFQIDPKQLIEFIPRCDFHQNSLESQFRKQKLITQLFHSGRITLTDRELKSDISGIQKVDQIINQDEFYSHLEQIFNINPASLFHQ